MTFRVARSHFVGFLVLLLFVWAVIGFMLIPEKSIENHEDQQCKDGILAWCSLQVVELMMVFGVLCCCGPCN